MDKVDTLKEEIFSLKTTLSKKHQEKESWFSKKEALRQEILKAIDEVKKIKKELDQAKAIQGQHKAERDKWNQKTKELIAEVKQYQQAPKVTAGKKNSPHVDVRKIQQAIKRLDTKIETEALEFDKEKKVMTQIKKLKKLVKENEGLMQLQGQKHQVSKQIQEAKKKADEFHNKFQEERSKEKENFSKFLVLTQKINALKKQQEEAYQRFHQLKAEYGSLSAQVKGKFQEKGKIFEMSKQARVRQQQRQQQFNQRLLEQKSRTIEEKLKNKKKLTTEDIIAFQGMIEKK